MKYLSKLLIKNVEIISAPDNEKYFLGIDNDTISVISKEMPTGFENAEIINASDKIAWSGKHSYTCCYDFIAQLRRRYGIDGLAAK